MALCISSENWHVANTDHRIVVTLNKSDLDFKAVWLLVDEIAELANEHAKVNIHVDCGKVRRFAGTAFGKFITLAKRLRNREGCLVLANVDAGVYQSFRAARLTENLDIRACSREA